jgi:Uma2 family endonuclease
MVSTSTKPISLAEFLAMPETEPASEFIDGRIYLKPMPQGKHSILQMQLILYINSLLMVKEIAIAFPELRCTFGDRSIVPDVAVFQTNRIPKDADGEVANVFSIAPDWVIEILSPEQSSTKVIKKILHCLQHGTEIGWLIDPAEKSVFIYRQDRQVEAIDIPERELIFPSCAESVKLTLGEIFAWLKLV